MIPIQDIIKNGKIVQKTGIVTSPQWIKLSKCPNMRRVEGYVKLSISIIFSKTDLQPFLEVFIYFDHLI